MGGGGSSERLASAEPTQAPYYRESDYNLIKQGFVNYNEYYKNNNKINIAILFLILMILLFHLYIKSKIK